MGGSCFPSRLASERTGWARAVPDIIRDGITDFCSRTMRDGGVGRGRGTVGRLGRWGLVTLPLIAVGKGGRGLEGKRHLSVQERGFFLR